MCSHPHVLRGNCTLVLKDAKFRIIFDDPECPIGSFGDPRSNDAGSVIAGSVLAGSVNAGSYDSGHSGVSQPNPPNSAPHSAPQSAGSSRGASFDYPSFQPNFNSTGVSQSLYGRGEPIFSNPVSPNAPLSQNSSRPPSSGYARSPNPRNESTLSQNQGVAFSPRNISGNMDCCERCCAECMAGNIGRTPNNSGIGSVNYGPPTAESSQKSSKLSNLSQINGAEASITQTMPTLEGSVRSTNNSQGSNNSDSTYVELVARGKTTQECLGRIEEMIVGLATELDGAGVPFEEVLEGLRNRGLLNGSRQSSRNDNSRSAGTGANNSRMVSGASGVSGVSAVSGVSGGGGSAVSSHAGSRQQSQC